MLERGDRSLGWSVAKPSSKVRREGSSRESVCRVWLRFIPADPVIPAYAPREMRGSGKQSGGQPHAPAQRKHSRAGRINAGTRPSPLSPVRPERVCVHRDGKSRDPCSAPTTAPTIAPVVSLSQVSLTARTMASAGSVDARSLCASMAGIAVSDHSPRPPCLRWGTSIAAMRMSAALLAEPCPASEHATPRQPCVAAEIPAWSSRCRKSHRGQTVRRALPAPAPHARSDARASRRRAAYRPKGSRADPRQMGEPGSREFRRGDGTGPPEPGFRWCSQCIADGKPEEHAIDAAEVEIRPLGRCLRIEQMAAAKTDGLARKQLIQ